MRVVFQEQSWERVDLRQPANGWMLSLLERNFEAERYTASITLIPAEPAGETSPEPASPPPLACGDSLSMLDGRRTAPRPCALQPKVAVTRPGEGLTAVIPAHNRVGACIALIRFLHSCGFKHRITISS